MALNSVNLIGRLAADPEKRVTSNKTPVCNFTICVDRNYKNENGEYDTDFFTVNCFGKTAEFICKWFGKGNMIAVSGRLIRNKWVDKDGNNHSNNDIIAESVYFCGGEYTDHDKPKKYSKK